MAVSGKRILATKSFADDDIHLAPFQSIASSAFGDKGHSKISNFAVERIELTPESPAALGQTVRFEPGIHLSILGKAPIRVIFSALATAGGGQTVRYIEHLGVWAFQRIRVRFGSQGDLQTILPIEEFTTAIMTRSTNDREAWDTQVLGGLTVGERETLAASPVEVLMDFSWFWAVDPSKYLIAEGLDRSLSIDCEMETAARLTQTSNGAAPGTIGTITSMIMDQFNYVVSDAELTTHIDRTLDNVSQEVLIHERVVTPVPFNADGAATVFTLPLDNVRGNTEALIVVVRRNDDILGNSATNNHSNFRFMNFIGPIQDSQLVIYERQTNLLNRYERNIHWAGRAFEGAAGANGLNNIYSFVHSLEPRDQLNSSGHWQFSAFGRPTCLLEFPAAPAVGAYTAFFISHGKNIIEHHEGKIQKPLTK